MLRLLVTAALSATVLAIAPSAFADVAPGPKCKCSLPGDSGAAPTAGAFAAVAAVALVSVARSRRRRP